MVVRILTTRDSIQTGGRASFYIVFRIGCYLATALRKWEGGIVSASAIYLVKLEPRKSHVQVDELFENQGLMASFSF